MFDNIKLLFKKKPEHPCEYCGKEQSPYKLGDIVEYYCKDPDCIIAKGDDDSSLC
jgi:hypothetical protein